MLREYRTTPAQKRQQHLFRAKGDFARVNMILVSLANNPYLSGALKSRALAAYAEIKYAYEVFDKEIGWKEKHNDC